MRRIEIRVVASSDRGGGLDTYPERRVHAVERHDEGPRQRPMDGALLVDADGVKYRRLLVLGGSVEGDAW
jgi:hypothetical protein